MTRRTFLPAVALPALGGAQTGTAPQRAIIEIGVAHLRNTPENQGKRVSEHWQNTVMPALKRAGAGPIGVFSSSIGPDSPFMLTVTSYPSFPAYGEILGKISADQDYIKAAVAFDSQAGLSYQRVENSLLRAFEGMPTVEPPKSEGSSAPKVFELRTYESNNFVSLRRKINMFNQGEIAIFRKVGMIPVFFGQTIVGRNMPNLVYMLAFNDMAHRDQCWRAFGSDPDWKKLRETPGYADAEIVSNISNIIVNPYPFSQIR